MKTANVMFRVVTIILLTAMTLLLCFAIGKQYQKNKQATFDKQVEAEKVAWMNKCIQGLHATGSDRSDAVKHVRITENVPEVKNPYFVPVHIYFRKSSDVDWEFRGSGTILVQYEVILSAFHVFRGVEGQFSYRVIVKDECIKDYPFIPITGVEYLPDLDDVIKVFYDVKPDTGKIAIYPKLAIPNRTLYMDDNALALKGVTIKMYKQKETIRLLTQPDRAIKIVAAIEVAPGKEYILTDYEVTFGESGSGGLFDNKNSEIFVLHTMIIPPWPIPGYINQGRRISMGHRIRIEPM